MSIIENVARLVQKPHGPGRVAGIVEGGDHVGISALVEVELAVPDQIRGKLGDVHHLGGGRVFEDRTGHGRSGHFQKIGRAVHGIHVLVDNPPHMTALTTQNPLDPKALRLGIHLAVQFLHHLVGCEEAEVAALGRVGGPGVVQADGFEEEQVAHAGEDTGFREDVGRGRDEEHLRALAVEAGVDPDAGQIFDVVTEKLDVPLEGLSLDRKSVV